MTFGARQLCGAWVSVCFKNFPSTLFPKYAANSGTHEHAAPFHAEKPQVEALRHPGVLGKF